MKGSGYLYCVLALTLTAACINKGGDTFNSDGSNNEPNGDAGAKGTQKDDEPNRRDEDDNELQRDPTQEPSADGGVGSDSNAPDRDDDTMTAKDEGATGDAVTDADDEEPDETAGTD